MDKESRPTLSVPMAPPRERVESIDAGQVGMATVRSGRRAMPTGASGSPIGLSGLRARQGWSSGRSAHCTEHRRWTMEWQVEERMQKNGGRMGENYEEIKKKMKPEFLIERIC